MRPTSNSKKSFKDYPKCIWMQASVVNRKFCRLNYICSECRFDKVLRRIAQENDILRQTGKIPRGKKGKIILWREKLKSLPTAKKPCIHHMKGQIAFRTCTNEYRCGSCDFDQYFHDQYSAHAVVKPFDVLNAKGFKMPQGYYFHRGHTWVKIEENAVRVGVDEFALRLMGPLDQIKTPLIGKVVKQESADILAVKGNHQAKLLSPVSGIVTAINPQLREEGNLANQAPYTGGWVMIVQPDRLRQDLKNLMINDETTDFISAEVERLYNMIEDVSGPLATDGGQLGNDIFGSMPQLGWERLTHTFLHV